MFLLKQGMSQKNTVFLLGRFCLGGALLIDIATILINIAMIKIVFLREKFRYAKEYSFCIIFLV